MKFAATEVGKRLTALFDNRTPGVQPQSSASTNDNPIDADSGSVSANVLAEQNQVEGIPDYDVMGARELVERLAISPLADIQRVLQAEEQGRRRSTVLAACRNLLSESSQ